MTGFIGEMVTAQKGFAQMEKWLSREIFLFFSRTVVCVFNPNGGLRQAVPDSPSLFDLGEFLTFLM